ncbi:hypothetical protein [Asticcacaulis excentricus]|uniref:hypothetical protein n=1 Tax=Asticcacaulis excentricus TaxID=78587 RepID=UPI000F83DB43|nr:hypothetical protein [Asticcacaulis excentricus]
MSAKAQKRLLAKQLKLEKSLKKNATIVEKVRAEKTVSTSAIAIEDISEPQTFMSYSTEEADTEGTWSWGAPRKCADEHWFEEALPFLTEYSRKKWGEIDSEGTGNKKKRRQKHCHYNFSQIITEAYNRLVEIKKDDFADRIYRFRLGGKLRLYGFRVRKIFYYLWYDREHKIYLGKDS